MPKWGEARGNSVTGLKSSGEELTKQCWFGHRGQCWNRQCRRNRQSRQNRLTVSLDRLDSPRLDKKDCWSGHWGSGSHANRGESAAQIFRRTWARRWTVQARQENSSRGHAGLDTVGTMLESAAPTKSAKSAESAAGAAADNGSLHADVNSAARDGLCKSWGRLGPI